MTHIKIQKLSKDRLSKEEFGFDIQGLTLVYSSYFIYHRNNTREKWADEKPKPLSFDDWCRKNNKSNDDDCCEYHLYNEYQEYKNKLNPVLQKTKSGKSKLSSLCAQIKDLPKCPDDVANKAALEFCSQIKVIYK